MYKRRIERFEPDELLPAPTTSRPLRPRSRSSVGSTASRTSRTHDGRINKGKGKARDVSEESISRGPGSSSDGADDGRSSKRRKLELDEADDTDVLDAARSGANSSGHGRPNRKGKGKARQLSAESTSRRSASVASGPSNQVNTDDETTFSPSNPSRDKGKGKMRAEDIMDSFASEDEVDELARTDSDIEPPATQQSTLSQAGSSSASAIDLCSPETSPVVSSPSLARLLNPIDSPTAKRESTKSGTKSSSKPTTPTKLDKSTLLSAYTCPVCFSPPTNATLTPCGHVLCGSCLFASVKAGLQRNAALTLGPGQPICPVCRAAIPGWDGKGGGVIGLKVCAIVSV